MPSPSSGTTSQPRSSGPASVVARESSASSSSSSSSSPSSPSSPSFFFFFFFLARSSSSSDLKRGFARINSLTWKSLYRPPLVAPALQSSKPLPPAEPAGKSPPLLLPPPPVVFGEELAGAAPGGSNGDVPKPLPLSGASFPFGVSPPGTPLPDPMGARGSQRSAIFPLPY